MSEFSRYQKEQKKKRERARAKRELENSIILLCRKRDDYIAKAKDALKTKDEAGYRAHVALLKNCIFNIKQAQDLRANYIIAEDLLEMQTLNKKTLKHIESMMKDVYKTSSAINIQKSQKIFNKALDKRHQTAGQLQDLLRENHMSFESSVNTLSDITDTEIKDMLQGEIEKEGNNTEDLLASLEATFPGSEVKAEPIKEMPLPNIELEGRPSPAPAPKPAPAPEVKPEPKEEPKPAEAPAPAPAIKKPYVLPPLDLLQDIAEQEEVKEKNRQELEGIAQLVENKLKDFGVAIKCENIVVGPSVSRLEYSLLSTDVQLAKIAGYESDIAMAVKRRVRLLLPIRDKNLIGVEVANAFRSTVGLKQALLKESVEPGKIKFLLGEDIEGRVKNMEFKSLPHMLVAGQTGSGKSVFLQCLINSLLFRYTPDEVQFVLIDFKRVEFFNYNGLPNLINGKVIDEHEDALEALKGLCAEMDKRYALMTNDPSGVDSIEEYNNANPTKRLPTIVCIIDEYADMVGSALKKEFNFCVTRLVQKARAASIHIIISTQRPSVDVIDGVIKANLPTKIALSVANHVDSGNIINASGAQNLTGMGDMLMAQLGVIDRYQSPFISKPEVKAVIAFIKQNNM